MSRRGPLVVLCLLILLLVGGVVAWRAATPDDGPDGTPSTPTERRPARRRTLPAALATASVDDGSSTLPGRLPPAPADWYERLASGGASTKEEIEKILAEAGRGKPPGGGLHEVLRRASETLAVQASGATARVRGEAMIEWAVDQALRPYREDRALFARVYREVRFGEGKLDVAGGSLARELRFREAAKRIQALRPELQTECYEALADRLAARLVWDDEWWKWFPKFAAYRGWDVPPAAGSSDRAKMSPRELAESFVLPHLIEFDWWTATGLAAVFVDLGEPDAASALVGRAREASPSDGGVEFEALERRLEPLVAEIAALRDLRDVTGWRVPVSADGSSALAAWFGRRRTSDVAHSIGAGGPVELGTWDDAMTKSWLEGGLAWAPEQWQAGRAWTAAARDDDRDGIRGWTVRSPTWEVFSDVSPEFSGEAAIALEAAWMHAQFGTGVRASAPRGVGARIYRHRSDYEDITHDHSGGEWHPGLNAVLSFLDDPLHTDFEQFRYPTLMHEATHAVLSHGGVGPPEWIGEGLACYVERWDPTASLAVNVARTKDWVRRPLKLKAARDAKLLPTFDELTRLVSVRPDWVPDDFGPITAAHYAAAESLFVHLADDPATWTLVGDWLLACRNREDPASTLSSKQRADIAAGWGRLVDLLCGPPEAVK